MKKSIFSFLSVVLAPWTAWSLESSFFVNQGSESSQITIDFSQKNTSYDTHQARMQILGFELQSNINGEQIVWFHVPMARQSVTGANINTMEGYSLADFSFGSKWGKVFDIMTLTYGLTGSISPGLARNPALGWVEKVNSFSGHHSLAPFIGFESYSGALAFGALAEVRVFSDIRYEDQSFAKTRTNPDHFIPKIQGFAQMPVISNLELGARASVSRNNFAMDELILGSPGNEYETEMYGIAKIEKFLHLQVSLTAETKKYPIAFDQTRMNLGLTVLQ